MVFMFISNNISQPGWIQTPELLTLAFNVFDDRNLKSATSL